jgi:PAS domain S-box-containing protein
MSAPTLVLPPNTPVFQPDPTVVAMLRQFVEEVPAAVAVFDHDMRYVLSSGQWMEEVRLPDSESHMGRILYELMPEMPPHWIEAHQRGLAGERLTFELEQITYPDGETRWFQWGVSPWHTSDGGIGGVIVHMRDQTQQVVAERLRTRILEDRLRQQIRVEAGEQERRRISRELHDGLGQLLTAAKLNVDVADRQPDALEKAQHLLGQAIREIRHIAHELRPSILDDFGLVPALRTLCDENSTDRLSVTFRDRVPVRLPEVIESAVFRICQEALTNVVRHSQAHQATVDLYVDRGTLFVMIQDDGVGMEPSVGIMNGIGMINMRERAEMLGGTFHVDSSTDGGTDIVVEIPLP